MNKTHTSCRIFLFLAFSFILPIGIQAQSVSLGPQLISKFIRDTTFKLADHIEETHLYYQNRDHQPMAVYVIKGRLKRNKIALESTTPFNKDTFAMQTMSKQIKWKTNKDAKVLAGVNADFFNMTTGEPVGVSIANRHILKDTAPPHRSFVGVKRNGKVIIGNEALFRRKKRKLNSALGAYQTLVEKGRVVPQPSNSFNDTRHPRTALGIMKRNTVILVVVDGRQADSGNGMPLDELAELMKVLGAKKAVNLDGGGSSTLISYDEDTKNWLLRNKPSGGRERNVANGWVITQRL